MFEPEDFPEGEMRDTFKEMLERPMHYVLDAEHNVIPLPRDRSGRFADTLMWAQEFEKPEKRRVAQTTVRRWWGKVWVSTVFLGLDHNFAMQGPPILFESMAFSTRATRGQEWENMQDRYSTWNEAVAGHWFMVYAVETHRGTWTEALNFWCPGVIADFREHMARFVISAIDGA